ncbi:hypothetical protein N7509_014036 [Penicillium cosmopolitanum]|uniref:PKS/mFAS DH domain-containing protein n=1 Tax=Penicillium cosmopolitanum TaxID=1131564 RepID=A0A9W9S2I3_9EURO|nr:uncharacterized protein N7509_014036 [Penicillium cosmopolitanum]KAJ5369424.1 hypothetical protein N7509_014036 [Penicillium cosmopolitanum]
MTGHVEAAYLAAREHLPHMKVWLQDLRFEHPVILVTAEDFAPDVLLEITSPANDFVISSRPADSTAEAAWKVCSRGRINAFDQRSQTLPEALDSVRSRVQTGTEVDCEGFYWKMEQSGLRYGDAFRCVQNMWRLGDEIFSYVKLSYSLHAEATCFRFHPALLDSCLHTAYADQHHHGESRYVYLPYHIDQLEIFEAEDVTAAFVHIQMKHHDDMFLRSDASIYGESGQILAVVTGITTKRIRGSRLPRLLEYQVCFQPESQERLSSVEADFENVLILDPQTGEFDWQSVIQKTFPHAQIHQRALEPVDIPWKSAEWGFELDRRVLVIVPAFMSGSRCRELHSAVDMVMKTLLRVASWLHENQGIPTIVIVTKGGCMTPSDLQCDPLSSSVEAAARVMANELPRVRIRCVDLALYQSEQHITLLEEELRTFRLGNHESVVAIRPEGRFFRRIVAVDTEEEEKRTQILLPARGGKYFSEPDPNGSLDNIVLRQQPRENLGPDDVGIEVHAAGINFKDIMNGLGLLSERAISGGLAGQKLGLEIAGRVMMTGENVQDIDIGTSVMARVSNGLGGFAIAHRNLLMPIPSSLEFSQAACLPAAFITAYYALAYLGRLASGESVLIHSAAGGVGMAAIQVAKHIGARVYATAGSPARRARVAEMGVEAVFDSRSVTFHDQVKAATGGQGVDVVLNSLTGIMFSQSVACLAPFGRFLEIGKTDIYRNMRLGLEQFGQNISFFAIDVDRLATQKPDLHRWVLNEVCALFESGRLVPLPITKYPITELSTALKALSRSAVIGKVAVEMPDNAQVHAAPLSRLQLRGGPNVSNHRRRKWARPTLGQTPDRARSATHCARKPVRAKVCGGSRNSFRFAASRGQSEG